MIKIPTAIPGNTVCDKADTDRAFLRNTTKPLKNPLVNQMNAAAAKVRW
ncbi:MAG: hypothetical protein ACK5TA_09090 [bacterium]